MYRHPKSNLTTLNDSSPKIVLLILCHYFIIYLFYRNYLTHDITLFENLIKNNYTFF